MTKEQFDNYRFGVNTEVLYKGKWLKLDSVDFETRNLSPKTDHFFLSFDDVEDIKN
jgi:hypothetical protein